MLSKGIKKIKQIYTLYSSHINHKTKVVITNKDDKVSETRGYTA